MPHIFLEDIEAIDKLLKEASGLDAKFTTKDYEFNNVSELTEYVGKNAIHELDIGTPWNDKSDLRVSLYESVAYVTASDKNLAAQGAYNAVCQILRHGATHQLALLL